MEEHLTLCSTQHPCSLPISPLAMIKKHRPGSYSILLMSSKAALFVVIVVNMHDSRRSSSLTASHLADVLVLVVYLVSLFEQEQNHYLRDSNCT